MQHNLIGPHDLPELSRHWNRLFTQVKSHASRVCVFVEIEECGDPTRITRFLIAACKRQKVGSTEGIQTALYDTACRGLPGRTSARNTWINTVRKVRRIARLRGLIGGSLWPLY